MSAAARALPFVPKPVSKLSLANTRGFAEINEKRRTQLREVAAFDAMCEARPLKPPPLPSNLPARVTAGAVALRRDKILGVYEEPRR